MVDTEQDALDTLDAALAALLANPRSHEKRTIAWRCYVNPLENEYLKKLTEGVRDRGRWQRERLLGIPLPRTRGKIPSVNRQAYLQIVHCRSGINQIAKAINAAQKQGRSLPIDGTTLEQLRQLEVRLIEIQRSLTQLASEGQEDI